MKLTVFPIDYKTYLPDFNPIEALVPYGRYMDHPFGEDRSNWGTFNGVSIPKTHNGIDWGARKGTPVLAAHDGRVVTSKVSSNGAEYIIIDQGTFTTRYFHLTTRLVQKGQDVKAGDTIGTIGDTGLARGDHLHFGMRTGGKYVNPVDYFVFEDNMRILKSTEKPEQYVIIDDVRYWILDPDVLERIKQNHNIDTEVVDQSEINQIPYGGGYFISSTDDPLK